MYGLDIGCLRSVFQGCLASVDSKNQCRGSVALNVINPAELATFGLIEQTDETAESRTHVVGREASEGGTHCSMVANLSRSAAKYGVIVYIVSLLTIRLRPTNPLLGQSTIVVASRSTLLTSLGRSLSVSA